MIYQFAISFAAVAGIAAGFCATFCVLAAPTDRRRILWIWVGFALLGMALLGVTIIFASNYPG